MDQLAGNGPCKSEYSLATLLLGGMFEILKRDNEENGVTACRAIQDIVWTYRIFTDKIVREFLDIFSQQLAHLPQMVNETLMAPPDPRALPPAMRSFRVLSEMGIVIVTFAQTIGSIQSTPRFAGLMPLLQGIVPRMYEVTCLEAPAQREARTEFEAMGAFWSGMAPTIPNAAAYTDYITAQIKVHHRRPGNCTVLTRCNRWSHIWPTSCERTRSTRRS